MTRAYIRLDPEFVERKSKYPDGAYAALVDVLCLAEAQPQRGRFRSLAYLRALLDRRGRWAKYLLEHRDLRELPDGRIYVIGWDEWQEGDWKVGERVHRIRSRRGVTPDVTEGVTPGVTVENVTPLRLAPSDAGSGGDNSRGSDGAGRGKANGRSKTSEHEEREAAIARARSVLEDPTKPDDIKQAARFSLERLGAA